MKSTDRIGDRRRIAAWLAGSLAVHALLAGALGSLVGFGNTIASTDPFELAALTVTIATPLQAIAVPAVATLAASSRVAAPSPAEIARAPSAGTIRPAPQPAGKVTPGGQVTINIADTSVPIDPAFEAVLRQFYSGAAPAEVEFDILPAARYPKAALAEQRNVQLRVLVIMHEDGRVELAKGSLHDPLFTPSIRESLAGARVRPAADQGRPPLTWAVLLFVYEFVGATY